MTVSGASGTSGMTTNDPTAPRAIKTDKLEIEDDTLSSPPAKRQRLMSKGAEGISNENVPKDSSNDSAIMPRPDITDPTALRVNNLLRSNRISFKQTYLSQLRKKAERDSKTAEWLLDVQENKYKLSKTKKFSLMNALNLTKSKSMKIPKIGNENGEKESISLPGLYIPVSVSAPNIIAGSD